MNERTHLLFTHCTDDGNQKIFAFVKIGLNLCSKVALGHLDVIFGGTILSHEVEEAIVNVNLDKEEINLG